MRRLDARRRWRSVAAVVALLAGGASLSACSLGPFGGGSANHTYYALFSDVGDLSTRSPVQVAGVQAGSVTSFTLDGNRARVTMSLPASVRIPVDTTAEVRRTTLLGQDVIDLIPHTTSAPVPILANGATLASTDVVPGLEDLVQVGASVIGSISVNQLALLIHEGAEGFGGEGPTLHDLLSNLDTVIRGYASQTNQITSVIDGVNQLSSSLAPNAQANALAITNLANTTKVLDDQANRLLDLLAKLRDLSVQGSSILTAYLPQIDDQLQGLRSVTQAVANRQQDLGLLLHYLPLHNQATQSLVRNNFAQVVNDFVICGLPGGGDTPGSAVSACNPPHP